jgi:hypothetical protein
MATAMPIIAVGSALYGAYQGQKAVKGQKEAAEMAGKLGQVNADLVMQETEEELRRTKEAQTQIAGQSKAMAAASGLGGATIDTTLKDIDAAHQESLAWLQKSGESRAEIARMGGEYQKQAGMAGAGATQAGVVSGLTSGLTTAYGLKQQQGKWW